MVNEQVKKIPSPQQLKEPEKSNPHSLPGGKNQKTRTEEKPKHQNK